MKILVTADFQADWANLDLCEEAWQEVLEIAEQKKVEKIIVAGDLKSTYNPVDLRVVKWWMRAVERAKKQGQDVVAVLGNHDRLGQYVDADNWFPVLRRAGAICVDKEEQEVYVRGGQLFILPFCRNKNELKERAKRLVGRIACNEAVLIFHEDINGCRYSRFGKESRNGGVESSALFPHKYRFCIGGHIHLPQKISPNIYYCGSPFCHDWGEANQQKGYTVITEAGIEFISSGIAGWFDPSWPGFYKPKSWEGTRVRLHVECESTIEYVQKMAETQVWAAKKYPGAEIYVKADFTAGKAVDIAIASTDSDSDKIREYVKRTCPAMIESGRAVKYLVAGLEKIGLSLRYDGGIEFIGAYGENFLSFKTITVGWAQKGISIVQGRNMDRMGKSNGSGKTSLLQTIAVALFGATFKGQKHDRWSRRNAEGTASIYLVLRDGTGREIKIVRKRRPTQIRVWVDGKEKSTGMKPQDKLGTQGLIERMTGFTWQTLSNAVYIDQSVAHAFLAGTKKQRTEVLARFQNLERFESLLKLIKKDRTEASDRAEVAKAALAVIDERISGLRKTIGIMMEESEERISAAWKEVEARRRHKQKTEVKLRPLLLEAEALANRAVDVYEVRRGDAQKKEMAVEMWVEKRRSLVLQQQELSALQGRAMCPTCKSQLSPSTISSTIEKMKFEVESLEKSRDVAREEYARVLRSMVKAEAVAEEAGTQWNKLKDQLHELEIAYKETHAAYIDLKEREHNESGGRRKAQADLVQAIEKKKSLQAEIVRNQRDLVFYEYCERAVSRDGIPAFLNGLLCGPLNLAAEYYADLFCDKAVQIRFELENGEFVPVVLNATGGEDIDDQSSGEKALAGLIASFALREVAPKCNLLILDEPGDGLDPMAAQQFARGLTKLKEKFTSIWITTHNPAILSELANERVITVVKRRGVSTIQ